jgi:hypothetical protein
MLRGNPSAKGPVVDDVGAAVANLDHRGGLLVAELQRSRNASRRCCLTPLAAEDVLVAGARRLALPHHHMDRDPLQAGP